MESDAARHDVSGSADVVPGRVTESAVAGRAVWDPPYPGPVVGPDRYRHGMSTTQPSTQPTARAAALTVGVSYPSDWHAHIDTPDGPVGLCLGGLDEDFDPAAATRHLAAEGWRVIGEWTETPPTEEFQFVATVERVTAVE